MALDRYLVLANEYDSENDAVADFNAVRTLYTDLAMIDTYDAAVLNRGKDGKVTIVKRVEEPTRQAGAAGLVIGLAVGAIAALFPAVTLAAGLLGGGGIGAAIGAIAGHVRGGINRTDLKNLGDVFEPGTSGLLVVAATDMSAKVDAAITRAKKRAKANLQADTDAIKKEIDRAA
jgi:uncharacterized membrane protein